MRDVEIDSYRGSFGGERVPRTIDIDVRPSPIEGLGLFATRDFRPGERVIEVHVVREITPEAPIREDLGERVEHCAYPDGKVVLIAYPERQVNHSCDPNAYEHFEGHVSHLVARRPIAAGEEITLDYNINITDGTAWPCHCGAPRCRGLVAGDYFRLPPEWQAEYRPFLAEWFIRRNRARLETLVRIVDLTTDRRDLVDQAARILQESFCGRSHDWQDLESARREVIESLEAGKISRVALDASENVVGWIGSMPSYGGNVWEIHPLVVAPDYRRRGVGRALVADLEDTIRGKGALTLWAGSDDETFETTLSGADLYADVADAIRGVRNLAAHPYEFYLRLGFTIVGVMPDANGPGKPDIFLAKRVSRAPVPEFR